MINIQQLKAEIGFFIIGIKRGLLYFYQLILEMIEYAIRIILGITTGYGMLVTQLIEQQQFYYYVWAIVAGQVAFSVTSIKSRYEIEEHIRTGQIYTELLNPVNYIHKIFFSHLGENFIKALLLLTFVIPALITFAPLKLNIFIFIPLFLICMIGNAFLNIAIGVLAFVMEDSTAMNIITSRIQLILGNQIVPIAFMPLIVQDFAKFTPFYLFLGGPLDASTGTGETIFIICGIIVNILVLYAFSNFVIFRLNKHMIANG